MRFRHLALALLVPAGTLVGHAVAYGLQGGHGPEPHAHGYLDAAAPITGLLALVGPGWHAWQGARGARPLSLGILLLAQPMVFLAQEGVEHSIGGHGLSSALESPAVRTGVLVQLAVAAVAMLVVRAAGTTGHVVASALRPRTRRRTGEGSSYLLTAASGRPFTTVRSASSERGPPPLLALD